jgi:stage II sporulation protein D (peptidoglycan lytic transglycosylase)
MLSHWKMAVMFWLAVSLAAAMSAVARAETIRVALLQQTEPVVLSSAQGLLIRTAGEDWRDSSSPRSVTVSLSSNGSGLVIDGRRLRTNQVELRGRNGEIVLNGLAMGGQMFVKSANNRLLVINLIDLEEYVKGVVPAEMNAAWHPAALKVQAIAARSYALYQLRQNSQKEFDIMASTKDQVYRGRAGASAAAAHAVDSSRGLVLVHGDSPIFAAYHSTAAGATEDASYVWSMDLPYLKGVECPFDVDSPHYQWRTDVSLPALERRLRDEGYPVGVIATVDTAAYTKSGRVAQLRILHSDGELFLRGEDLRRVIGYTTLASTQFDLEILGLRVQFNGKGAGHGVGLCQWGAKELAERGYTAETILRYFYPGTELRDLATLPKY